MGMVFKIVRWSLSGIFVLLVCGYLYSIWKFNHPPRLPHNIPADAIWVNALGVPFQVTYRGAWLGCSRLQTDGVQCVMTDWDGTPQYGDIYVLCDEPKRRVSDSELRLKPMEWMYGRVLSMTREPEWAMRYRLSAHRMAHFCSRLRTMIRPKNIYKPSHKCLRRIMRQPSWSIPRKLAS
jgi:hypothetical protein